MAGVIGIALGTIIGQSVWAMRGLDPIFQVLRTISPLAWLPISLAAFRDSQPSAIFVIFITSVWPIIINTAVGIRNIPQDYRNVALVLRLNPLEFFTKIMIPSAAPYIFTGLRIGIGLSWLAIVAAEMLTGGVGIGFFIWDAWNSSRLSDIVVALVYIGGIGFVLDRVVATDRQHRHARHRCQLKEPPMSYLKIDHVDKTFTRGAQETEVLSGITVAIEKGEYVSIIGHSGCGKSTLLNIVAGLTRATNGGVLLENKEVNDPGPDRAVVFQNHSLLPWLTVYDNVRLAVDKVFSATKSRKERHAWTMHNLELVQMGACQGQAAGGDLGRHEAARRHRPRAGHGAQGAAAGRAVRRARCADARAPAGLGDGDPCPAQEHGADDHARRRRGRAAVRPHRHDDQRSGSPHRRGAGGADGRGRASVSSWWPTRPTSSAASA